MAFGRKNFLERLREVRSEADDSLLQNDELFPLINQINESRRFLGRAKPRRHPQAIRQIVPDAAQFPQANKLLDNMRGLMISVEGTSDLEAHFQMLAASPQDTVTLSQLLQAGLLLRQNRASQANPDLTAMFDSARIVTSGIVLDISFFVTTRPDHQSHPTQYIRHEDVGRPEPSYPLNCHSLSRKRA